MNLQYLLADLIPIEQLTDVEISGLCHDSRIIKPGNVFLAYPGAQTDGRQFIKQAIKKGAGAVLYEPDSHLNFAEQSSIPVVPVPGLTEKQGIIAARYYHNPSAQMTVIGVTGTNGKTSCTQFLAQAFALANHHCGVIGTLGYGFLPALNKGSLTTPDALALQKVYHQLYQQSAELVAMEVSSHALAQGRVNGVEFDVAVLTQLSRDHLDYHGDMKSYAAAKAKLFAYPSLKYAVINADDTLGQQLLAKIAPSINVLAYSMQAGLNLDVPAIKVIAVQPSNLGFVVTVASPWGTGVFTTGLLGRFNIANLLAVLSVLCILSIPFKQALVYLSQLETVPGRMQRLGGDALPTVVIDYSHTPDSLQQALCSLREHCNGRLWCVFGCGGDRDQGKRPIMGRIAEQYADCIIITNDNPRHENPQQISRDILAGIKDQHAVTTLLDRAQAIGLAVQSAEIGDIVLVAGKGHETIQIVADQNLPFSDEQIVQHALECKMN